MNEDSGYEYSGLKRILVVDDDRFVLDALRLMLERLGYQVSLASDGIEALNVYFQQHPDIVLTDLQMPRKDGLELIYELKSSAPHAVILAMSGTYAGSVNFCSMAVALGAREVLVKPFSLDRLLAAIQDAEALCARKAANS